MGYDIYSRTLPVAFPWVVIAPKGQIAVWVRALMSTDRIDVVDGSSFAVDVVYVDRWRLWMSDVSYKFLNGYSRDFDAESTDVFLAGE